MDEYQYPLFFEAKDLTDREREKIRRHFQKKRDSGGGECGVIEKAGGNMYKISFKEKDDQERVLQRKFHTISLPSGDVCLTVSRTSSPDQPGTQTFTKTNTKSLEKIFRMDIYLLHYLRDNAKANKVLQKSLSAIDCTLEFNIDDEEVVVRGDIEKGLGGAFGASEKWEIQVDRVFIGLTERYISHHVLEPKQVRLLQQDLSFVTDDVKVYSEIGYSVIVGEAQAVKEKIEILEKSTPTRTEVPITGKQFTLIEEEFTREMSARHPDVQIHQSDNLIIMEGPDNGVQSGAKKLFEMMKNIKEKRVKLPTDLLTFISSSGAASKFQARFQQNLRNPVFLEVASDLLLSSLSSGALDEAWAALQRDLKVDTVKLHSAAHLDRIKEILNKAKDVANNRELRVNFSVIPGVGGPSETKVRIVGYSENVKKLKDVLQEYQMNHVETEETVNLPHPEMVDCFDRIRHLIGMNQTKVTLRASSSPRPHVLVSGPRCHVQEAHQALTSALASLAVDTLVLDGPGAQRFFQTDGKVGKDLVESSCQVLIKEQQGVNSQSLSASSLSASSLSGSILSGSSLSGSILSSSGSSSSILSGSILSGSILSGSILSSSILSSSILSSSILSGSILSSSGSSSFSATSGLSSAGLHHNTSGNIAVDKISLMIKISNLEDEKVNAMVAPMINKKLTSTNIGKSLLSKAGNLLQSNFNAAAGSAVSPGAVIQVTGPPSLGLTKLFFIECLPWDGATGQSVQALSNGLKRCLELCVQQGLTSVAFPIIGPGIKLKYPPREATQVLTESIYQFGVSASSGSLNTIHVVLKPGYPDTEECYHDVYTQFSSNMNVGGRVIFRSLTSDLDDVQMKMGRATIRLVFGDITNETTDAIVNTTDFVNFQNDGVCKDILTVAGPQVEAQLRAANVTRGEVFTTPPGSFPCKALLHVCGERDAGLTELLVCRIIQLCISSGHKSVAIPAIGAGLDACVVAGAILRGIKTATSSSTFHHLTDIRLILIKIDVFLEFKKEAMQKYSSAVINRVSAPQMSSLQQRLQQRVQNIQQLQQLVQQKQQQQTPRSLSADPSILQSSVTDQKSSFLFVGLSRQDVDKAMAKLQDLYQTQCSKQTFTKERLEGLTQDDMEDLKQLVETEGVRVQMDQSGPGSLMVSGLKDAVNQVTQKINTILQDNLRREVRAKEEEELYGRVAWCILGVNGNWERLPKKANHELENNGAAGGIVDTNNIQWTVDLQRMEAKRPGQTAKLKQLKNLPDFTFPLYWDNMAAGENMKVVVLDPSSAEYRTVKEAFKRTAAKTVIRIERLQNIHLRRGYEVQKKQISDKTGRNSAGEKLLYHGTTQDNCDSIMKTGFNRSFAGQNATAYGDGTYFAVDASYSANTVYSKPAADGSQMMFVARVLTGLYTVGKYGMKAPPAFNSQQPHDRYDSVVDNTQKPSMYVAFHDHQAYPDYLITFK
ncbi:protein mono-ADP-ribosyltransferase PARP14-like isoform X2 [Echeneis naucrates]|uniref:protein mono-ADP-ribosyltransferase PARP14-like isoform X2 n=1 Tax=Echeneis naucrates TaxID=173247 RepID=UPI0011136648|nr:protein mono-ADP-ribosyltransferase PARP14-like isoform X2 [Echeneis naucrates]